MSPHCTARNATKRLHHRCLFVHSFDLLKTHSMLKTNKQQQNNASKFNMSEHTMCMILAISRATQTHEQETETTFWLLFMFLFAVRFVERMQANPEKKKQSTHRKTSPRRREKERWREKKTSLFCVYVSFSCFAFYSVLLTRCKSFE